VTSGNSICGRGARAGASISIDGSNVGRWYSSKQCVGR